MTRPHAVALYLFPTKALAQDQLGALTRYQGAVYAACGYLVLLRRACFGVFAYSSVWSFASCARYGSRVRYTTPVYKSIGMTLSYFGEIRFAMRSSAVLFTVFVLY